MSGNGLPGSQANGVDYVVETTGRPEMAAIAAEALALLGTAGLIGMPNAGVGETQKGERVHGNNESKGTASSRGAE